MSDVDAALAYVADPDGHTGHIWNEGDAARVLAAEVRRLRAGIERVRALPRLDVWGEGSGPVVIPHMSKRSSALNRDDVLAALEGE